MRGEVSLKLMAVAINKSLSLGYYFSLPREPFAK